MPLNKGPVAPSTVAPVAAAIAPVAVATEKIKARTLKAKATDPVEAASESVAQSAAASVGSLQPSDMKPEQKRIQRSGIFQAVVQSNALVQYAPTLDSYLELVEKVSDRGLQYVNRA